ncbi:Protein lin-52-like protein [Trichoplax sp. H2]|nr:Protein lin-52-like protein [Trichoplax sp. H2]|eukprot:RDD43144.1 Protein lin-52-like protein [Trichoplax sp. H2]
MYEKSCSILFNRKQKVELTHCNDLGYWIGKVMDQDIEQSLRSLLSDEHLDRDSPDLWSDPSFGYNVKFSPAPSAVATPGSSKWQDESQNDREILIQELASLTKEEVLKKVRDLQNFAYQLGSEEAREMTRGKYLNILQSDSPKRDYITS